MLTINNLSKSFDNTIVLDNVSLTINHGEFVSFLGSSGCGKTTLLNLIAGFDSPDSGELIMDNRCVNTLPPQQRNCHTVFQNYALFPHLSVYDNVAFSLRCQKLNHLEIVERVEKTLVTVGLTDLANRKPIELSGGQQQRTAIARAIIGKPKMLLLDEPLSALDYRLRKSMQYELKQLQRNLNMTFIFVTHDQEEALSMSDRIIVFNNGHIEQIGTPREIYETPTNLTVANFIGETNIIDCKITACIGDKIHLYIEAVELKIDNTQQYVCGDEVHLLIRPEDIRVWGTHEVDSTENMIPGKIIDILYKGSTVDLKVILSSGKIINATEFFDEDDEDLEYVIGQAVWIHWLSGWEVVLPYEK